MFDLSQLTPYLQSFVQECCDKPVVYEEKGILNIEGFYWWSLVGFFKPDIILESGVSKGRSTEILARAQQFFKIQRHYAFDIDDALKPNNPGPGKHEAYVRAKLSKYKTKYTYQSSIDGFTEIYNSSPMAKIVAIIDGPKADGPFKDVIRTLAKFTNLQAIGSHDCSLDVRTRDNFAKSCKEFVQSKDVIFTTPKTNRVLSFLNSYIITDVIKSVGAKKADILIDKSNYIGFCI